MVSLGAPPQRLTVDVGTAQQLVAEQFPEWAGLPVRPVDSPGWDNYTFRLGDELTIRLPSAAEYALAVEKEQRWLPRLAPHLPVPIPSVRGAGVPGAAPNPGAGGKPDAPPIALAIWSMASCIAGA